MAKKEPPVRIIINNHKSRLLAPLKVKMQVVKRFRIKHPNYFWSPLWRKHQWDGYVKYMGEDSGLFKTGLLDQLCQILRDLKVEYTLEDNRETFKDLHAIKEVGGKKLRDYQLDSVNSILNNKFEGIRFQRGILNDATNAGKSIIAAGIIESFSKKRVVLFITNNKTLFDQALPDMQKLLGKDQVGWVKSSSEKWGRVNVCMSQTLGGRVMKDPAYKNRLAKVDIIIVDEADEIIGRKDCQKILEHSFNATIRVALTGTANKHKNKLRNQDVLSFFGPIVHVTTNKELVDKKVSTPPDIRITTGSKKWFAPKTPYAEQYEKGIVKNTSRHKRIWKRVEYHLSKDRVPILILFRIHEHAKRLIEAMPESIRENFNYEMVHGETSNREKILKDFNEGKTEVLLASMIIKRGKNLPLIKVLINAAGGDSEVTVLQIFGRALRSHKSKKKVIVEDLYDEGGDNIRRHSKHRIRYYKNQGFPVKELYKKLNK